MAFNNFSDVNSLFTSTVVDCLKMGEKIESRKDTSFELLGYSAILENPLARITTHPLRTLDIVSALARFTWLVAGSNRLEDIAFYEPKVTGYTDNGLTVPGSCYGARLMGNGRPGLNQIEQVVERLQRDPLTRRAAAVVWTPEDATCSYTNDLPCEFGMFFFAHGGGLTMINIMRSNNAFRLLPFNVFEFTMLGELVASELGVPFYRYHHFAASMHVINANSLEWSTVQALVEDAESQRGNWKAPLMDPMPTNSLGDAQAMARLEAELRHCNSETEVQYLVGKAREILRTYWFDLFMILVVYKLLRLGSPAWNKMLNNDLLLHFLAFAALDRKAGKATKQEPRKAGKSPMGGNLLQAEFLNAITNQPSANPYANIEDEG